MPISIGTRRLRAPWNKAAFVRELLRIGGSNLVAYWPLDDASGVVARDMGPDNEPLTITGCALGQAGPPQLGRSHYFDGVNNVDSQKVYDTQQGALTFVADGGSAEFRDAGQDFSAWATTPVATATYMLVVTSDNGVSWGYMGAANNGNLDIDIYSDKGLTTRGWKGRTTPQATPDTPASYEVRKTLFQITGALTVGVWAKGSGVSKYLLAKADFVPSQVGYGVLWSAGGNGQFFVSGDGSTIQSAIDTVALNDSKWHFIVATYTPSTAINLYVDGNLAETNVTAIPAALFDSYIKFLLGARSNAGVIPNLPFVGNLAHDFICDKALTAAQIKRVYDIGRRAHSG